MNKELTLEEIQQNSFNILMKIKEIFDENGWKYYLAYGTLIGAVRHQGFIPWDDDIDIWVPREDYEKFISYCIKNEDKLGVYKLFHYKTNSEYIYTIARFSDTRYKIDYDNVKDYGLGLFVDIYPLDGIKIYDKKLLKKMHFYEKEISIIGSKKVPKGKNIVKNILKMPFCLLIRKKSLYKLIQKSDKASQKYSFETEPFFKCVAWEAKDYHYKKEWLGDDYHHIFNGQYFRIPEKYDEILKCIYGDYMQLPPIEERIAHHFYKAYIK